MVARFGCGIFLDGETGCLRRGPAPLGSRLRGNDGGGAREGGRLQCPASRGIRCGRFAAASPSLCERDGVV